MQCSPMPWFIRWTCTLLGLRAPVSILNKSLTSSCRSVKTRLQVQEVRKPGDTPDPTSVTPHYTSTWDALTQMFDEEGLAGLYAGMSGSLLGVASTNFAYFYWYSTVRALYFKGARVTTQPSTAVELALGAVAGALAQLFTIPVAVVTTRQQTQSKSERKGMLETAREVIDGPDGVTGLWRGLKASLVLVVNPSITYGAYERLKPLLFPGGKPLSAWQAFGECFPLSRAFCRHGVCFWILCANQPPLHSFGSSVQGISNRCHAATHRRQGRAAVQAPTVEEGQALQEFWRGDGVHHQERGSAWAVQGYWSPDLEGYSGARHSDDD